MAYMCDKCGAELIDLFTSQKVCPNGCDKKEAKREIPPGDQSMCELCINHNRGCDEDSILKKLLVDGVPCPTFEPDPDAIRNKAAKHKMLRELANYNTLADHHKKCYACQSEDLHFKQFRWRQAIECGNCGIRGAARPTEEEALQSWQEMCDKRKYPLRVAGVYKEIEDLHYEEMKKSLVAHFEKGLISANTFMDELEKLFARNNQRLFDESGMLLPVSGSFKVDIKDKDINDIVGPGKIICVEQPCEITYIAPDIEQVFGQLTDNDNQNSMFCWPPENDPKADEEYLIGNACFTYEGLRRMKTKTHFFGVHIWDTPKLHDLHGNELINHILKHAPVPPGHWTDGVPEGDITEVVYPPRLCQGETYHGHLFIKRDGSIIVKFIEFGPKATLPAWKDSK